MWATCVAVVERFLIPTDKGSALKVYKSRRVSSSFFPFDIRVVYCVPFVL